MKKRGIDISHHQGDIDFSKLKDRIDFAMVRTSYGDFYEDRKYKTNIKQLEKIHVPYGLYHFSYAKDIEGAKKEASNFINLIKNYNPTYPVVIDIEYSNRTSNVSNNTLNDIAYTFCAMVENAGYYVMIYANLDYFNNKLNDKRLDRYDKWLAEWKNKPTYNKAFGIWQYSSKGRLPGINGNVDLNISYKDYPSIIKTKKEEITDNKILENEQKEINYIVKKGDTLTKIANKYNVNWKEIYAKNKNKIGNNPNKIYPGMVLKI